MPIDKIVSKCLLSINNLCNTFIYVDKYKFMYNHY